MTQNNNMGRDAEEDEDEEDGSVADRVKALRELGHPKGRIVLNCNFTAEVMEAVYFDLLRVLEDGNIKEATIYLNSNGGDCSALFPLVDLIASAKKPVNVTALGRAYSCGAMLLLSGTKGRRKAHKHTEILLHEVASGVRYAKSSQLALDSARIARTNQQLIALLKRNTRMTSKQITQFMHSAKDEFITADEALRMGIIDAII